MKDNDNQIQFDLEDLSEEAKEHVEAEMERTGESLNEAVNRMLLEVGRRKFPGYFQ